MKKINEVKEEGKDKSGDKGFRPRRSLIQIMNRLFLAALLVMLLALNVGAEASCPILFVHGNGDSAAL